MMNKPIPAPCDLSDLSRRQVYKQKLQPRWRGVLAEECLWAVQAQDGGLALGEALGWALQEGFLEKETYELGLKRWRGVYM